SHNCLTDRGEQSHVIVDSMQGSFTGRKVRFEKHPHPGFYKPLESAKVLDGGSKRAFDIAAVSTIDSRNRYAGA
ncbi:MAG: hypothetical protein KAU36_06940, partial [candidate division Zixibacteria bacterium]|nr:hypothetical protein [candidate division Zixibacteria bacterium]